MLSLSARTAVVSTAIVLSLLLAGCAATQPERGGNGVAPTPAAPGPSLSAARVGTEPRAADGSAEASALDGRETYVVREGDTLRRIAQRLYGDAEAWRRIYAANREVIGDNPDGLRIGMRLLIVRSGREAPLAPRPPPAPPVAAPPSVGRAQQVRPAATPTPPSARPVASPSPETETPPGTPTPVARRLVGPRSVPASPPYQPLPLRTDAALEAKVRALLGDELAHYGVLVKRLSDGRGVALHAERQFYAASLFKLPVMYEVFKQRGLKLLRFDEALAVTPPYLEYRLGALRWPLWSEVSIRDLLEAMITQSDNVAAMLLYDKVGPWNIQRDLVALGLRQTDVASKALPISAGDMALLLEIIAREQAVDATASQEMVDLLSRQQINDRLPALLPEGIRVAHKTGNWTNATHDVGVVYAPQGAYVVAVLSDHAWQARPIAELSRLVYDHLEAEHVAH